MYLLLDRYLNIHSREAQVDTLEEAFSTAFAMVNQRFDKLFKKPDGTYLGPDHVNIDHMTSYNPVNHHFIVWYWDGQATYGYIEIFELTTRDVES